MFRRGARPSLRSSRRPHGFRSRPSPPPPPVPPTSPLFLPPHPDIALPSRSALALSPSTYLPSSPLFPLWKTAQTHDPFLTVFSPRPRRFFARRQPCTSCPTLPVQLCSPSLSPSPPPFSVRAFFGTLFFLSPHSVCRHIRCYSLSLPAGRRGPSFFRYPSFSPLCRALRCATTAV